MTKAVIRVFHLAISVATLAALFAPDIAFSSAWHHWRDVDEPSAFKVLQYLDVAPDSNLVIVGGGLRRGVLNGSTFKVYRAAPSARLLDQGRPATGESVWVETGRLKAVDVQQDYTVAEIVQQSSPVAKAFFPKFPGVMAGDVAVGQRLTIVASQAITPTTALRYDRLFVDPKATPATFELSSEGAEALRAAAAAYADAKLSMLLVEGYTDNNGPSDANQLESYQRAQTVRQYMIDELGFDPDRVVAVGLGEGEPADESNAPGYVETNRRIVLKALPVPAESTP